MPAKFKPDTKDRKGNFTHHYLHATPTAELQDKLSGQCPGRLAQKIRNELVRRKVL